MLLGCSMLPGTNTESWLPTGTAFHVESGVTLPQSANGSIRRGPTWLHDRHQALRTIAAELRTEPPLLPNESRLSGGRLSPPSAQHLPYPQVSSPSEPSAGVARPLQALVRQPITVARTP